MPPAQLSPAPVGSEPSSTAAGRRLITLTPAAGILCLRCLSPGRLRFEVEYALDRGTCANSFLLLTDSGGDGGLVKSGDAAARPPVLVHPPGISFAAPYLEALRPLVPADQPLRVVAGVVNPNRVQLLRRLARQWPALVLVASNAGARLLRDLWDRRPAAASGSPDEEDAIPPLPAIEVVKGEQSLDLGQGRRLRLLPAPTPRWPGGLMAFEESSGLLMSSKFLSAHVFRETFAEAGSDSCREDRRHFHDCLMAPMARQVAMVLDRLDQLPIRTIAPFHGPAIEGNWRPLLADYRGWGRRQEGATSSVALLYVSAYGNTAAIADALARGVAATGVRVESLNCEFAPPEDLVAAIRNSDALLLGSPTLGGHAPTPMVSALGTVLSEGERSRPVGVFGSYGWSGEAIDLMESKLREGGFRFAFEPLRVRFTPDPEMLERIEAMGSELGRRVLEERGRSGRRTIGGGLHESRNPPPIKALGRLVNSECILTMRRRRGDARLEAAMATRWVAQAGFTPPAVSVAVPRRDGRTMPSEAGDRFVLNVLAAGRENGPLKRFLRPLPEGEDPFAGMAVQDSPGDQPVLSGALAWLEVTVSQRVDCGDHWLILGEVLHGGLLDPAGTTAVHQRRSGTAG